MAGNSIYLKGAGNQWRLHKYTDDIRKDLRSELSERNISVGNGVIIADAVYIGNAVAIGDDAIIRAHTTVEDHAVIGCDVYIGDHVKIGHGTTISHYAYLGYRASIGSSSFIGTASFVGNGASVGDRVAIGDDATIGYRASVGHGVAIGHHGAVGYCASIDNSTKLFSGLLINGSAGPLTYVGNGRVSIGCKCYTIEEWREKGAKIGAIKNLTPGQLSEYSDYIALMETFHKNIHKQAG